MLSNPSSDRVRSVRGLSRRSARRRTGRILVEGPQGVREAVAHAPREVVDVYVTADGAHRHAEIVTAAGEAGLFVHEVSDEVLEAMCDAESPQGLAAVVQWSPATLPAVLDAGPRLLVLLTEVRDPGNLGTVIRGADAAGADAVLLTDSSVDVTAPKVVRSTAGSLFHLPVVTGLGAIETLAALERAGVRPLGADGGGEHTLESTDLRGAHVWVMGNEAHGLSDEVRGACRELVRVPIYGRAESLNLAMASTLCLYASARQQRAEASC